MDPLGTDSCRVTVFMELPVPNGSMQHREPICEIDDTRMILQGASWTIAAGVHPRTLYFSEARRQGGSNAGSIMDGA
jgi:hypothetical protein